MYNCKCSYNYFLHSKMWDYTFDLKKIKLHFNIKKNKNNFIININNNF